MHHRTEPIERRFEYDIFMFYLDLDELDLLRKRCWLFSKNHFNYFSFWDKDHLQLPAEKPDLSKSTKEHLTDYLRTNGVENIGKIMLLTNLKTMGYQFNPVSFYFVFDKNGQPICTVPEVGNTFGEMKPYFIGKEHLNNGRFNYQTQKLFYVSPFIQHDVDFDFKLRIPDQNLDIRIDDIKDGRRFFVASLKGHKKELNNFNLIRYALFFPLITLKVIMLIHWQAFKLWWKKLEYFKKEEYPELQVDVYRRNTKY